MTEDGVTPSKSSIYGSAFETSAIGELTSVSGQAKPNKQKVQGSSFAVPYVSALASLVHGKYLTLMKATLAPTTYPSAADIKLRLLATSHLMPKDNFEFGPIDFDRALALESDTIEFTNQGDVCDAQKTQIAEGLLTSPKIFQAKAGGTRVNGREPLQQIKAQDLLRVMRDCGANSRVPVFDVIVREKVEASLANVDWERAVRYTDVDLQAKEFVFDSGHGTVSVPIGRVLNYTPCMRPQRRSILLGCLRQLRLKGAQ
jgi:hypothetical protein